MTMFAISLFRLLRPAIYDYRWSRWLRIMLTFAAIFGALVMWKLNGF
jgi:hypothetical protein